jgi:hypothetical protein
VGISDIYSPVRASVCNHAQDSRLEILLLKEILDKNMELTELYSYLMTRVPIIITIIPCPALHIFFIFFHFLQMTTIKEVWCRADDQARKYHDTREYFKRGEMINESILAVGLSAFSTGFITFVPGSKLALGFVAIHLTTIGFIATAVPRHLLNSHIQSEASSMMLPINVNPFVKRPNGIIGVMRMTL